MERLGMSSSTYCTLRNEAIETDVIRQGDEDSWEAPGMVTDLSQIPLSDT
jgi:hypothetical protein